MRREGILCLAVILAAGLAVMQAGCGGGSGDGSVVYQREIAAFTDPSYVEFDPGNPDSEAGNLVAALRAMGRTVKPFTGTSAADFTAALADKRVLIIPELEAGDLNAVLDTAGRGVISDFVTGGGTLLLFNESPAGMGNNIVLVNGLFGHSIPAPVSTVVGTISRNDPDAAGTVFEDSCPAVLDNVATVKVFLPGTLPVETRSIYTDGNGSTAVALLPKGNGQVLILGWDWQGARPVGTGDGGWWSVLFRAVSDTTHLPVVAVVSDDIGTGDALDVVSKLKSSGQFARVGTIDAAAGTPSLSRLKSYDAVMVYSNPPGAGAGFADTTALGNVVADYVDRGGGLVTAYASFIVQPIVTQFSLGGRYAAETYNLIPRVGENFNYTSLNSGTAIYGDHPVLAGFLDFNGGNQSLRADTTSVVVGATEIIAWADGVPLVVTGEIGRTRRADLGFLPVSDAAGDPDLWDAATDGDKLMANALTWAADLPEAPYDSFSETISSPDIPDGGATADFAISVAGGPESLSRVKVTVGINHPANEDLDITVTSPGGTTVELSTDNGGSGSNYSGVTFDDSAGRAAASFAGLNHDFSRSYIPEESLAAFIGTDGNGTWTLHVADDDANGSAGALNSWTLHLR